MSPDTPVAYRCAMAREPWWRRSRRVPAGLGTAVLAGAAVFLLLTALLPGWDRVIVELLAGFGIAVVGMVFVFLPATTRESVLRTLGRTGLLSAVIAAVGISLLIIVLALGVFRALLPSDERKTVDPQYPVQFALWTAAGIGGVVALVVAYRRQRLQEDSVFVELFGTAAAQLGSPDPAVRIAGVYAMAGVADNGTPVQMQQCLDVLCGYLRLPYDPEHGSDGLTEHVFTHLDPTSVGLQRKHIVRANDRQVRQTVQAVLSRHLRMDAKPSWSWCDFDLRGAVLEDLDFMEALFAGSNILFIGASFTGHTRFDDAHFAGRVRFDDAHFAGRVRFDDAKFVWHTVFDRAHFTGHTQFDRAHFTGLTQFGGVDFSESTQFIGAHFTGITQFYDAHFSGRTDFSYAQFSKSRSDFHAADFTGGAVTFAHPESWDPPPRFDWDNDVSIKPTNVKPDKWPPKVEPRDVDI